MKKAPPSWGAGKEYINALDNLYSDRSPQDIDTRICYACGTLFHPIRHWHKFCRLCFHWHKALSGIAAAREAFREMDQ